jgi:hypothetical protein
MLSGFNLCADWRWFRRLNRARFLTWPNGEHESGYLIELAFKYRHVVALIVLFPKGN